jgi:predicted CXXCH cytochrome family protein
MRTIFYCFVAVLALLIVVAEPVQAQTIAGKIVVLGITDRDKAANGGQPTHGITNVGIGARIVFKAVVVSGVADYDHRDGYLLNTTSATWTLTEKPSNSQLTSADIKDTVTSGTAKKVVYFVPDSVGKYTVTMTAVTDSGTTSAQTVTFYAAKFVGVGAFRTSTGDYSPFNCAPCHNQNSGQFAGFKTTNHQVAVTNRVNEEGGHFADYCMRCHTASTAGFGVNDGYDEYATPMGFHIPHNGTGVWDSLLAAADTNAAHGNDSLLTLLGLMGIQCESCHGPASEHAATGNPALMGKKHSSDPCAPCHASSDRHPKGYSWEFSLHAIANHEIPDAMNHMNRTGGSCGMCHTGQGFVEEQIGAKTYPKKTYTGGTIYADVEGIGCVTCHDPHDKTGMEHQLYRKTVADACTGCHTTRISGSRGLHHAHQGQVLQGVNVPPMDLQNQFFSGVGNLSGWQLPGYKYSNSAHSEIEERCVKCHMAPTPDFDPTFANPDTLLNKVGGHTWKISWTDVNGTHVNNMGCSGAEGCHGGTVADVTAFVEVSKEHVQVLLDSIKANLPLNSPTASILPGEPKVWSSASNNLNPVQAAASYNYYFVTNDGSGGVHNPGYVRQLLESSFEQLKLGNGAAEIASVKDVPGDQGKRVQVVWNKFPAEAASYNRVVTYGVWREDPQIGTKVIPVKNYTEMFQTGEVGQQYSVSGLVWTYVAAVPASNFALYSYISETLKDSSAAGAGTVSFKIVGYAKDNAAVYASQPFTGYSVDNLPPLRVVETSINVGTNGATLTWKPNPEDQDIAKYLIYRGTTKTFTPGAPLAEVTARTYLDAGASSGTAYYYQIRSVDHAGNLGALLDMPLATMTVEQLEGLPTAYALGQNYPNPFNPSTTINFSLPEAGTVVLQVYTISGELVNTIAQGEFPAGNFKVTWNATDSRGAQVASGMYIYRLQSGTFSSVKKMIMLK